MDMPTTWIKNLPWAEFAYNISYREGTGMTPFEVVYGRKLPALLNYVRGISPLWVVDYELATTNEVLKVLRKNL